MLLSVRRGLESLGCFTRLILRLNNRFSLTYFRSIAIIKEIRTTQ